MYYNKKKYNTNKNCREENKIRKQKEGWGRGQQCANFLSEILCL